MLRRKRTRWAAVLALTLLMSAPAAADPGFVRGGGPGGLWAWMASWVESAFSWKPAIEAVCDDGASIDPNGCPTGQSTPTADDGASIDPDG